jgi:hypothetical protein
MRRPPPARRGLRLFTGRLGVVVISALVLAAMAGTAVLLLGRRSDDERTERRPPAVQPTGTVFGSRALGVAGIRPRGWRLRSSRRALRLTSPERAAIVAISAAPPSAGASALMSSTLAAVGRSYRNQRISRRRRAELGRYAGIAVSGSATNSRGVRLDLLISTAKGRRRTYLLQVFVARAARLRVVEAQGLVESLEFSG